MGRPKATLEWHGSTLVRRAAGIVGRVVDGPVVVVRAAGQELPALPPDVEVAQDARDARGPLQGIAAGLAAIGDRAGVVFVCAVDAPLLHPALARHVIAALADDDYDVALPQAHGFPHPLAAAYRTTVAQHLHDLLGEDRLGTRTLLARCRVRRLDEAALLADPAVAAVDPELHSLLNLNAPSEYDAARARPAPAVTVTGRGDVRAATLAEAGEGPATVNGRPTSDPEEPLVAGDVVAFVMRQRYRPAV
ncbi:MAG: molybdenum cofactor guanylyltransferase [Solirubrobacteraceae bacterium]|jgi:molybdopterin-guanine dinucleotide biosynthesis protein A|nr:molybdenum cofactor guanylyltransferase [Solirubrobacteraceae bacterium]